MKLSINFLCFTLIALSTSIKCPASLKKANHERADSYALPGVAQQYSACQEVNVVMSDDRSRSASASAATSKRSSIDNSASATPGAGHSPFAQSVQNPAAQQKPELSASAEAVAAAFDQRTQVADAIKGKTGAETNRKKAGIFSSSRNDSATDQTSAEAPAQIAAVSGVMILNPNFAKKVAESGEANRLRRKNSTGAAPRAAAPTLVPTSHQLPSPSPRRHHRGQSQTDVDYINRVIGAITINQNNYFDGTAASHGANQTPAATQHIVINNGAVQQPPLNTATVPAAQPNNINKLPTLSDARSCCIIA